MINVAIPPQEEFKDEFLNYDYLKTHKFGKKLEKLNKKLNNKKVVLYGADDFLRTINKYFDLSKINILGIYDKKYDVNKVEDKFLDYKILTFNEVLSLKPDYILIASKFYKEIEKDLKNQLKDTDIKLKIIVKKTVCELIKEVCFK